MHLQRSSNLRLSNDLCNHDLCRGNEADVDEEHKIGTLAMYESRAEKGNKEQQVERERAHCEDWRCREQYLICASMHVQGQRAGCG